ncbi:hypothetical protein DV451_002339 [Geotrichum candidum]|uniref:Pyruvate decarboxylase n=1 Tax=Geotrichum candidum TaxID=1173061 RepID=A0A9P5G7G4_GEOCN|nr:hypothetical protein DV451_002339 [Geotrichum candidum]KAF5105357.1 hypothetical protein DV453_004923 [Geotrichum candidum]KAF5117628.1 hypothetical protein DV452_002282 [Geotrichum candidum]KAI8131261.1 hypothetical protein DUD61_005078 [Geotrichum candidum]KAI9214787.1 hypothetical protein DS838_000286 [Geotrichum bryndzae]
MSSSTQTDNDTIPVGTYLFNRIRQLGINSIFGLPGDFNLALLDHISEVEGLRWVGNTNELNAGYAADGYSRLKSLAVLITTFGVGELSTVNAIAGAFAEHVGLLHIVGVPAQSSENKKLLLHHTLGNGDYKVYARISKELSKKVIILEDSETAPHRIDDALRTAFISQRPVYLAIPTNVGELPVRKELLETPIDLVPPSNDPESEKEVVDRVLRLIEHANNPVILVDACANRHDVREETARLAEVTQFPVFTTPMGKSAFDEDNDRFGGVYIGSLSSPEVAKVVESSDLILSVGALLSDFNTGSFSYGYNTNNLVEFHSDHIKIKRATYEGVSMKPVLRELATRITPRDPALAVPVPKAQSVLTAPKNTTLTQDYLWANLSSFLRPGDVIVSETGTSSFGITKTTFPNHTVGISQVLYGSIGYSVGAALGAALAIEEIDPSRRVILLVGDGSLQLTAQAISTMIRWNLNPYLFVLNNDGYTIERLIHGPTSSYNDINPWRYTQLLEVFNAQNYQNYSIKTTGELDDIFESEEFAKPNKIRLIELVLPRLDAPLALVKQAEITSKTNAS